MQNIRTQFYRWRRKQYEHIRWELLQGTATRFKGYTKYIELRKNRAAHCDVYREHEAHKPLVSVTIATYNRADILAKTTIPSVLNQTYQNFEIIIIGDGCSDNTQEELDKLTDSRVFFYNLPKRSIYPNKAELRWMVAGSIPMNHAITLAKGEWIAHLDDDDVWLPQHLESLLHHAYAHNLEAVYSQSSYEKSPGIWETYGRLPFYKYNVTHSAFMMRQYLRIFPYSSTSWKLRLPSDSHMFMRMAHAGVRSGFLEKVTVQIPLRPNTTRNGPAAEDRG